MRALLLSVLLTGVAFAQAQTQNLHLLLGGQGYENQNWQALDQALCGGTQPLACPNGTAVLPPTVVSFGADPTGATESTGAAQKAIDSGQAVVTFPAGTFAVCNLQPRAQNQVWQGAGVGQTIITGTVGCNNTVATSFGGIFGGPSFTFEVKGIQFQGAVQNSLSLQCRDIAAHVYIHNNAFDTGGVGCPTTSGGPSGINLTGCRDYVIRDNEFFSTCPGSGGRGILMDGVRGGLISGNRSNWQRTFLEIATTANRPSEFTNISDNTYHGTFWGIPTKYTNSGGTVTYSGTGMVDTAANFAGLCDGGAASPCAAAAGSFIRVLTSKASGSANFNTSGGMLQDNATNFSAAGVLRGDIIKTGTVCFGNGPKGQAARFACPGSAGTASWGDSCVCTANADCASTVCEPRWATVDTVSGDTHTLQVDEWVRETACPLGASVCATSTRRPTGAPLTTSSISYTVFGWTMCQIASYTTTAITCTVDNWVKWTGSATTPANGTLYELMWTRPLYNLLAGNLGATTSQQLQGIRAVNNVASGGFADQFELFGTQNIVVGNHSRDCGDTCFVVSGDRSTVTGNFADHCGARGILMQTNDSTATGNVASDSPWVRTSNTTTTGDIGNFGARNTFTGNKVVAATPTNIANFGFVSFGNATGNSDQALFVNNTCQGAYATACYRFDATGGTTTNNHLVGYHGETISNNGGTFSIEGGLSTFAQMNANAAQNGSYQGCSDCTATCAAGASLGHTCERVNGAWTN